MAISSKFLRRSGIKSSSSSKGVDTGSDSAGSSDSRGYSEASGLSSSSKSSGYQSSQDRLKYYKDLVSKSSVLSSSLEESFKPLTPAVSDYSGVMVLPSSFSEGDFSLSFRGKLKVPKLTSIELEVLRLLKDSISLGARFDPVVLEEYLSGLSSNFSLGASIFYRTKGFVSGDYILSVISSLLSKGYIK